MLHLRNITVFLLLVCSIQSARTQEIVIDLQFGGDQLIRGILQKNIAQIFSACNRYQEDRSFNLVSIKPLFTSRAFNEFAQLADINKLYFPDNQIETNLIESGKNSYEIRDIRVRISKDGPNKPPIQYLVMHFDVNGIVEAVYFSLPKQQYQAVLNAGESKLDQQNRQQIINFIERYRTSYNRRDSLLIEQMFSNDALIVVGRVFKRAKQTRYNIENTILSDGDIQFLRLSKFSYLERLRGVFRRNEFLNIEFEEITVQRHPQFNQIYGVSLAQKWESSTYSDIGYLFLMVDFANPDFPILHVRSWQPQRFSDGSTLSIFDFNVIE